jgi:RNA polymerase sigma factor (sigma-70 family)
MVLGVCRRALADAHDAEDVFQATFLVLVRRAASIRRRERVGSWLYGVAYRTALEARGKIARRRAKERPVQDMPHPSTEPEPGGQELRRLLDQELSRLADKYRLPLVLCDLEGRSRKQVARQLQIPEGTLSSRLATGRRLLAGRLTRRGLALSGSALAALLAGGAASAAVPAILVLSTVQAAARVAAGQATLAAVLPAPVAILTERVLKVMFLTRLKTVALVVLILVGVAGLGVGVMSYQGVGAQSPNNQRQARPSKQPEAAPKNLDRRLAEVERRLNQLLEEVRLIRRDLKGKGRAAPEAGKGRAANEAGEWEALRLKHADAAAVAKIITELFGEKASRAEGPVLRVVADPATNSLLLRGPAKLIGNVKKVVNVLDVEGAGKKPEVKK